MINPLTYRLNPRIKLEKLGDNRLAIVKLIKSRIIRKDAEKVIDMAEQIKKVAPKLKIDLICTRNICSKSLNLLNEKGIEVIFREL